MPSLTGLALVAIVAAACGVPPPETAGISTTIPIPTTSTVVADAGQELSRARDRWAGAELSTYRYLLSDDCGECDLPRQAPVLMIVWDGVPGRHSTVTVPHLFDVIETALGEGQPVEVRYDPTLGYPTEIWIDREARAYDGGTHWLVHEFEPGLPSDSATSAPLEEAHALWEQTRPAAYELETEIICDCPFDGTMQALIEGTRVVDWDVTFTDGTGGQVSPVTVDDMFADLAKMLSKTDGYQEDGARFTGFALYDETLGYPVWVGMEIEVTDPESDFADLPPRLVTSVTRLEAVDSALSGVPSDHDAARERWRAAGIDDYTFELTVHDIENASFTDPFVVVVAGGVVTSITPDDSLVVDGETLLLSVEGLFDLIESHSAKGDNVQSLYHDVLGYPVFVSVEGHESGDLWVVSLGELEPTG